MNIKTVSELLTEMSRNKVMIYGAGYTARRVYKAVCEHGLKKNVLCYITSKESEEKEIDGLEIVPVDRIKNDPRTMICIAVHESIRDEIIGLLQARGFTEYVWVYPFLYGLILGEPIQKNVHIPLRDIWRAARNTYSAAFRYLAAEQYYGLRDDGYEIYIRGLSIFNSEETSKKRLEKYIELLKSWDENGYDESRTVSLMEDKYPIDGTHRIAIAMIKKMDYIVCDVYPSSKTIEEVHGDASFSKDRALEMGLDEDTIRILEETNRRIDEQYR
ncbi:hypothetical protein SAMN06296386_103250 [Lachnospiraceae bacterium]|nr:hypothetical protein SAMN06296386_103250 [Lachnospiraceae bacterium]